MQRSPWQVSMWQDLRFPSRTLSKTSHSTRSPCCPSDISHPYSHETHGFRTTPCSSIALWSSCCCWIRSTGPAFAPHVSNESWLMEPVARSPLFLWTTFDHWRPSHKSSSLKMVLVLLKSLHFHFYCFLRINFVGNVNVLPYILYLRCHSPTCQWL